MAFDANFDQMFGSLAGRSEQQRGQSSLVVVEGQKASNNLHRNVEKDIAWTQRGQQNLIQLKLFN